jgi:mono/diheme cytochrome c family protein
VEPRSRRSSSGLLNERRLPRLLRSLAAGTYDWRVLFAEGGPMSRIAVGMMLITLLGAASAAAQDAKARGEKVYADQKCSLCHSIGGKGNAKGPLDDVGSKLSADEIRAWITDAKGMTAKTKSTRKPEMKSYTLPKEDVDALVAYLSTLKKK